MYAMTLSRASVEPHTSHFHSLKNIQTAIKVLQVSTFPNVRYWILIIFDSLRNGSRQSEKLPWEGNEPGEGCCDDIVTTSQNIQTATKVPELTAPPNVMYSILIIFDSLQNGSRLSEELPWEGNERAIHFLIPCLFCAPTQK